MGEEKLGIEASPLRAVRGALRKAKGDHSRAVAELGRVRPAVAELARRVERLQRLGGPFAKVELSWFAAEALAAEIGSAETQAAGS